MPGQRAGKRQFAHPFRQRHHGGDRHGWVATDKHVDAKGSLQFVGLFVMDTNAAMDLVVEPDFRFRIIIVARNLHAVHTHVGLHQPRLAGVLGVHLRQRHKGSAIIRPALQLRQLVQSDLVLHHRSAPDRFRLHLPRDKRSLPVLQRIFQRLFWVYFEPDSALYVDKRIAKNVTGSFQRSEQIRSHRELAADGILEQ